MSERLTPHPDHNDEAFESTLTEQPLSAGQPTPAPEGGKAAARGSSRSLRILLGALLLALAAFIWFNFVWKPQPPAGLADTPTRPNAPDAGSSAVVPLASTAGSERPADAAAAQQADAAIAVADVPAPGVVPGDLEIVELPFLVTQPPVTEETDAVVAGDEAAEGEGPTRPSAVRASVNPFSPVVLNPAGTTAERTTSSPAPAPSVSPAADAEQVINVSIPDGPDQNAITSIAPPAGTTATRPASSPSATAVAAAPAEVPVPELVAPVASAPAAQQPGAALTQNLPRPLPGPSMSTVPDILQERRTVDSIPGPGLAQVVTIPEPTSELDATVTERVVDEDGATPDVLQPVATRVMPSDSDPLVAGVTPLSRYLRDFDVRFTGMVLGPVGQGVFHSSDSPRPVVVGIGQQLPETEITLTDLRGQQAEFTLADSTQFLTLDLRR